MHTQLSERLLVALRSQGKAQAGRFVDPDIIRQAVQILGRRGEQWAAAVLGRDLTERSLMHKSLPFLKQGEEYVLVLADKTEDLVECRRIEGDNSC